MGRIDQNRANRERGADLAPALERFTAVFDRAVALMERAETRENDERARFDAAAVHDAATTLAHAPASKKGH